MEATGVVCGGPAGAAANGANGGAPTLQRLASLVWFRSDLRLADHEPLYSVAAQAPQLLLPFYCLDERELAAPSGAGGSLLGLPQLGPHRLRLLLEGCASLRRSLRAHSSDLLWAQGQPGALVGQLVALAAAAGSTRLALHHYMLPGGASAELEDEVAAAFSAAAGQHGLACSVHRYWGCTLYHPDDLPYEIYSQQLRDQSAGGQQPPGSSRSSSSLEATAAAAVAASAPVQQRERDQELACSRANRQQQRFACLPGVMTDFRTVLQAHAPVRPPLPAPLPPGGGSSSSTGGAAAAAAPVMPPLPAATAAAAAEAGLLAGIPMQPHAVYAAAGPAAAAALGRWEALTGLRCAELAPAGSGQHDARSAVPFTMGEAEAVQRLRYYLGLEESDGHSVRVAGQPPPIQGYQDSRMQAVGMDSSAKLSAFLALGCLSPRTVHAEVMRLQAAEEQQSQQSQQRQQQQQQQQEQEENAGQQPAPGWREAQRGDTWRWLLMHLAIRDFFTFTALKEGEGEAPGGSAGKPAEWRQDAALFRRWVRGQTGLPFVDACMRELAASGYTSNRGRQNVASLLAKALGLDWRMGAEYFACQLSDHDWAVNLGNWSYNAGTGNDPRDRQFKTVSQGLRYDPQALLVRSWVPQLAALQPAELAHQPWAATPEALAGAGVQLGDAPAAAEGLERGGQGERGEQQAQQGQQQAQEEQQQGQQRAAEGQEAAPAAAVAAAEANGGWYPLPVVAPASQTGKGPRQKQQPPGAQPRRQQR